MSSPHSASTTGSAASESAESRSETTATTRRSMRSTSRPESSPVAAAAAVVTVASTPAASTSPVRSSTSSGMTTVAMPAPSRDMPYEANQTAGLRRISVLPGCELHPGDAVPSRHPQDRVSRTTRP